MVQKLSSIFISLYTVDCFKHKFSAVLQKGSKASRTRSSSMSHLSWLTWRTGWRKCFSGRTSSSGKRVRKSIWKREKMQNQNPKTKSNNLNSKLYNFNWKITNQNNQFHHLKSEFRFPHLNLSFFLQFEIWVFFLLLQYKFFSWFFYLRLVWNMWENC